MATSNDSTSRPAVLLVNLGTPSAPTAPAVRRYLSQFLHDHRVVQLSRWLWCPLLHFVILPLRGPAAARKYAQIWLPGGSPLAVHTAALAEAVQRRRPGWRVRHAMRYGEPDLGAVLQALAAEGHRTLTVLPLYPQYSTTTTESVKDVVQAHAARFERVRVIEDYSVDPAWVAAAATSIRDWRAQHGAGDHLLFSFHGLPQRLADGGDPYPQRCEASAAAIAAALGLVEGQWSLAYQSRFGRERWLGPATDQRLQALQADGASRIDVACPGFAVDCLETLEEVAIGLAEEVAARGGQLRYIPCLNGSPAHADALLAQLDVHA